MLASVNLLFASTWLIHQLGIIAATGSDEVTIIKSVTRQKGNYTLKAEVFNACGVKDVARQLSDYLRDQGIDVVYYGNYLIDTNIHTIPKSIIVDRKSKDLKNAKLVASKTGVEERYLIYQLSPERQVDVTVMIGQNYNEMRPFF